MALESVEYDLQVDFNFGHAVVALKPARTAPGRDEGHCYCQKTLVEREGRFSEMSEVAMLSTITCPQCGHVKEETMPVDACQWFYECENCGEVLHPKKGDCCVFCSYGTNKCPSIQAGHPPCCSP